MFWPSQRQRELAVNHYWNSVVEGAPSAPAFLDPGLAGLVDAVAVSDSSPLPERAFVDRLEAHLTSQAVWNSLVSQSAYVPGADHGSSYRSVSAGSQRFRLPDAGERSRLKAGFSWLTAQAAFVVLLIIIAGGVASIYLLGQDGEDGRSVIPAVVNSVDQATPASGNVVLPLVGAEIDPELSIPNLAQAHFMLVELKPGQSNANGICADCPSMTVVLVMDGQLDIDIDGPVVHVSENWAAIEQQRTEGEQLIQMSAGDAAVFNIHDVVPGGIVNASSGDTQILMGVLVPSGAVESYTNLPKVFTFARRVPPNFGEPLSLSIEEIAIGGRSSLWFEVSDCRTELYLLTSGSLSAMDSEGVPPGNQAPFNWRAPTGMQVDRYPAGTYVFQNFGLEPAHLYRLSVAYPAAPEACG